jgi:hypothetical protein
MIFKPPGAALAIAVTSLTAACLLAPPALAGLKSDLPVVVNLAENTARGSLGQTLNTANRTETIGCYIYYWLEDSTYAICEAVDAAGVRGSCYAYDEKILNTIRSLNGDSYLSFSWVVVNPGTRNDCTTVRVQTSSNSHPKR